MEKFARNINNEYNLNKKLYHELKKIQKGVK